MESDEGKVKTVADFISLSSKITVDSDCSQEIRSLLLGGKVERVTSFPFLGSKITVYGDYSHEAKRQLLLGRKDVANLDSVLKSRDITLPIKVHTVKAMVSPVVMYRCDSWTI